MGRTLPEKVWDAHVVRSAEGEPDLVFIDLHLVHEVTSPQAFDGLRLAGRPVRRPDLTLATEDHNVPTDALTISDPVSRTQVEALRTCYGYWGWLIILVKGLTPIPYKLVTIVSGVAGYSFPLFVLLSIVTRGARFFILAGILTKWGEPIKAALDRHFAVFMGIILASIVFGFWAVSQFNLGGACS